MIGDRWSLLIVRDLMVRGFRSFRDFKGAGEGIATNVLADRLKRLRACGIVTVERSKDDARTLHYRLTKKGIDLAPVVLELLVWGARHESPGTRCGPVERMAANRAAVLAEVQRRWRERDPRPLQVNGRWILD